MTSFQRTLRVAAPRIFHTVEEGPLERTNYDCARTGTYRGIVDLLTLRDPNTNTSIVDFLRSEKPEVIYVTGHSLGGTLSPPFYAYLNDVLYGGKIVGTFNKHFFDKHLWTVQAMYQHHVSTYQGLVDNKYPLAEDSE